jgi:large subunit ribosomal protein L17
MSRKHRSKSIKLNRNFNQRKALIRQQLNALISRGHLVTTETKAKLIKSIFDKTAAKANNASLHQTRQIIGQLNSQKNAHKVISQISPLAGERRGGFTKITKLGFRRGDNAPLAKLELTVPLPKTEKKEKTAKETKSEKSKKDSKTTKTVKKEEKAK